MSRLKVRVLSAALCVLSVCALVGGVSGCRGKQAKAERQAMQAEALRQEAEAQLAEIAELQAKGQPDAAMVLLDTCIANKKYKAYRPRFFSQKVDLLLAQDKASEAGALVVKTWEKEPQLAQGVFGRIRTYHQGKGDHAAILAWCKELLSMGKGATLPKGLRPQVLEWMLTASTSLADPADIAGAVSLLITELPPEKAVPLLQQTVNALITSGKFTHVLAILACLDSHKESDSQAYKDLAAIANLKSLLAQKNWKKIPGAVEVCAVQLKDDILLALLRQTFTVLQKNQQAVLLENVAKSVFLTAPDKKDSASYAARIWVDIGMLTDKRVLQERLVALLDAKVRTDQVASLLERYFYDFVEDHAAIKGLCVIARRVMDASKDEESKNAMKIKLMDGAFIVEDYDLALAMLEQGIPDKPKAWHDMSIPKVKAHRALTQDKKLEAIGYFRDFMKVLVEVGPEEEHDPTTGVAYSKEWILGHNAYRIATLYDALSDTANAAKAREEAKALFDAALEKVSKDDDTLSVLKAEMKEMGF